MKLNMLLFCIFLVLIPSCNNRKNDRNLNEELIVYNEGVYRDLIEENQDLKIKVIDTLCINQKRRAKNHITKGDDLIYFTSQTWYEFPQMGKLLQKHNIKIRDYSFRDYGFSPEFEEGCYEREMNLEIYKRFGENFIDSLWQIAERNFVLKYPDSIYIKEGQDIRRKYISIE